MINIRTIRLLSTMKNKVTTPDPSQKPISSFFQKSTKRNSSNMASPPAKIAKTDSGDGKENTATSPLSPEQKKRMEENRLKAQEKLLEKTTQEFAIGQSWKKALEPEFSKEYFIKV